MLAADSNNVAILQLLLTAGANVQLQNRAKKTALDYTLHNYLLKISTHKNIGLPVNHAPLFSTIALLVKANAQPTQLFTQLCTISLENTLTTSWPYVPAKTKLLIASLYKLNLEEYVTKEEIERGYKQAWPHLSDKVKTKLITDYHVTTDAPVKAIETTRVTTDHNKSDN